MLSSEIKLQHIQAIQIYSLLTHVSSLIIIFFYTELYMLWYEEWSNKHLPLFQGVNFVSLL